MKFKANSLFYAFLRWCPGALGFFLRQKIMPFYFKECGRKVVFGRFLTIINPQNISIASRCVLADRVTLAAHDTSVTSSQGIQLGRASFIGVGSKLSCGIFLISIGKEASIGSGCNIEAECDVYIEDKVLLAAYCRIGLARAEIEPDNISAITLREGSWLGARADVYKGVSIGKGCVVGAHGEVIKDLPAFAVAIGRPVRIIRFRGPWGEKM